MDNQSVKKISSGLAAVVLVSSLTVSVIGCGGEEAGPDKLCVPKEQRTCVCSDGDTGYQECNSSGTQFRSCRCNTSDTGTEPDSTCLPSGSACGGSTSCCSGSVCINYEGYGTYCGALCTSGSDCQSGCCGSTTDGTYHICAPCS